MRRICEITVTLDFMFRLVLCSHEDVSFNIICLNELECIKQFYLSMWLKETNVVQGNRLEIPFKGENVKALIKTSKCENLVLISLKKFRTLQNCSICYAFYAFWFSVTKQSLENGFGFPQ